MSNDRLKALKEEREAVYKSLCALRDKCNDENHDWTSQDEENWDRANADFDSRSKEIQRIERMDEVESVVNRSASIGKDGDPDLRIKAAERQEWRQDGIDRIDPVEQRAAQTLAVYAWAKVHRGQDLTPQEETAIRACGINPRHGEIQLSLERGYYPRLRSEIRAQSTAATEGGDYIPEGFVRNLEVALLEVGALRQAATVLRTDSGNDLPWPTTDDTSNTGAILGENSEDAVVDVVTGAVVFNAYKYTSKMVKASVEIIQDSAFDMAQVLGRLLGERIGRITNTHFTTGSGSSQPRGIVTAAATGVTTGSGAFDADDLLDLFYSVDPSYRSSPSAGFMMNDAIIGAARKFKDSNGQYMWQPALSTGAPDRFNGAPVFPNQAMDSTVATGNDIAIFGDLSKYIIRDCSTIRLRRLVERFAEFDQEGFIAYSRHDGDLINTAAVKKAVVG